MNKRQNTRRKGLTLVEIMAVIIILGILAGVVAVNVLSNIDKSKVIATKTSLKQLHSAVISFKMDTGRYPDESIGLDELIEIPSDIDEEDWHDGGYLETTEIPEDGWGNEFIYERYPASGKPFVIISYGADGEEGGEGYDKDLLSTDAD